jgi:hypothetical protein
VFAPDGFELGFDGLGPRTLCVGSITRQIIKHVAIARNDHDLDICSAEIDAD